MEVYCVHNWNQLYNESLDENKRLQKTPGEFYCLRCFVKWAGRGVEPQVVIGTTQTEK